MILATLRAYIANTDYEWYRFLFTRPDIDEVNFWRPGRQAFRALSPGEPVLFRLKKNFNVIAGVGFFVHFSVLPASVAWAAFGVKNGAAAETDMRARIETYRRRFGLPTSPGENYPIGCLIITETTFFPEAEWIREPTNWRPNIVAGRTEDLTTGDGARIWDDVITRLRGRRVAEVMASAARYGPDTIVHPRLGQGAFRILVTDRYERRCALTGERTLPVLEAAHIVPYASGGAHAVSNGLLLRSDLHTLFDRGYLTVTPAYRLEVSRRIREEFENGRDYYALHGRAVRVPDADQHGLTRHYSHGTTSMSSDPDHTIDAAVRLRALRIPRGLGGVTRTRLFRLSSAAAEGQARLDRVAASAAHHGSRRANALNRRCIALPAR